MEVKINNEIRNYTESMFFGLSLRQFIFFFTCLRCGGRTVFYSPPILRDRNPQLGVYSRCCSICGNGLCKIQRYDRRAICMGVD